MLLIGDLKFVLSAVVVVVGWLVARRKWRRSAVRKEEIRRLMAFASEEAARAELEADACYRIYSSSLASAEPAAVEVAGSFPERQLRYQCEAASAEPVAVGVAGSFPERQLQYQCEVCFSPTTTRCKQCKAVRYCSRKCQILHWRQGHKDECHSITTHRNIDAGVQSIVKESEQDGSSQHAVLIEMRTTKQDESSSETIMFSNSKFHELGENVDVETEVSRNSKRTDDGCSSTTSIEMPVAAENNLTDYFRYNGQSISMDEEATEPSLTKKPGSTSYQFCPAASSVSNEFQFDHIDTDKKSESSTLSGFSATGSEEHSISESSTPSSDFWAGSVEHMISKINALEKFDDVDKSSSSSSSCPSFSRINAHVEIFGSGINKVIVDDSCSAASIPKKSIALSDMSDDGLDSKEPVSLRCKLPGQYGDGNTSTKSGSIEESNLSSTDACRGRTSEGHVPRKPVGDSNNSTKSGSTEESKLSSTDASREGIYEGHVPRKPVVDLSTVQSLAPDKLDNDTNSRRKGILDTLKCQGNRDSRLSSAECHLSSSACLKKPAIQVVQSVENERVHDNGSCSLDSSSYPRSATSRTHLSMRRIVDQLRASNSTRHGSMGSGSGNMGRYEGSFPYELFVKLYNWNKVELSPCGLINCGNSCYANSVLQCFAFTPPLAAYCIQGLHAKTCKTKEWCFTCEFEELVKKVKDGNNPISASRILSQMQRMGSHLGNGREEDAHEFLRYAIDAMQSVCLREAREAEADVPSSLVEETTLLGLTFGGYLQSKIECMRCGGKSKQHEKIMDLTVEIEGEIRTLEDALLQFTRSEILDGENKYNCGRCKSYEKAKKKLRVLEAPNILVVALKRFQTGKFGKLNKAVKFPEILNLAPYMSGTSDKSPIYQLYGVVVHLDVKNAVFSGHYVCYIKNNQGRWFKADDSVVQVVELEKVLSDDAYILFYARCSPRAPRIIRSSMGPRKAKKVKSHPWGGPTSSRYFGSYQPRSSNAEECSSEYSSSYFSSEAGSQSTESTNRESVSTSDLEQCSWDGDSSSCWSVAKMDAEEVRQPKSCFSRE